MIVYTIMDYLVRVYFFDLITLQGDRHIWNFGVIIDKENHVRPAPIFDNANMCNLNRTKTVQEFMQLIESPKRYDEKKKEKFDTKIYQALYHSTLYFSANHDDFLSNERADKKVEQLASLDAFVRKSEVSYTELLQSYIDRLNEYGIENILKENEENMGFEFDMSFKKYIIEAMNLNLTFLNDKINEISKGGKHEKR